VACLRQKQSASMEWLLPDADHPRVLGQEGFPTPGSMALSNHFSRWQNSDMLCMGFTIGSISQHDQFRVKV
jgi:hypothetical protein